MQCQNKCISFFRHVPSVKKGTYNLVYVANADELDRKPYQRVYFDDQITKIKKN